MSLTSCYEYIIELPVATLNSMMIGVLSEADAAGVPTTLHEENVAVGAYTATVDAYLADITTNPPVLTLTAANLGLNLQLSVMLQVAVNGIMNLDPINYQLTFDFPGVFQTQPTAPPVLVMAFPGLTAAQLNLNVSGGTIDLTPALIKPQVDAFYAAHPALAQTVITGIATLIGTLTATVDIYDDTPGSMNYRGEITVAVPDPAHIQLNMPGHLTAQESGTSIDVLDSDINATVIAPIAIADGSITVSLSAVTAADVTVAFTTANLLNAVAEPIVAAQFAAHIAALGDIVVSTPTNEQINGAITQQLIQYGTNLIIPIFKPTPPVNPTDMDLTNFVPTTVQSQVLALQLEPQPVPCDTPDLFFNGSEFAVSVDLEKCNSIIQPVLNSEDNTDQNIQGHDVTLSNLTATLSDPNTNGVAEGHIWLTGLATVHLTCWPDAHITFSGPITLTPDQENGNIKFDAHAGTFTASNPCCGSVDPNTIAAFIQSQQNYLPISGLPSNFSGVGQINIEIENVDIFAAGIVLRGDLAVATNHSMHKSAIQHNTFWDNEPSGGG